MRLTAAELAIARLLRASHLAGAPDLPGLLSDYAATLGVEPIAIYLSDLQGHVLIPFVGPDGPGLDHHVESLDIDGTLAGRAFQLAEIISHSLDDGDGSERVWLPLLDGTERLGLLGVTVSAPGALDADDGALRQRLLMFASVAAELIMTKTLYGDTLVRLRRTSEMGLAAEMQWSLLPPPTFANSRITVCGGLEPAYEVGGDTFDYAVDAQGAHLAIFDGMGHGLRSAQLAALAVTAYRNARRGGRTLVRTAQLIDSAVAASFEEDAFLTGLVAQLDTHTGALRWVNAGHPSPLLLREGRLVKELESEPALPLGLGGLIDQRTPHVGQETLQPGDVALFYSDGVVEARSPRGEFFGATRLVELVTRHLAAGLPMPETMRRVIRSLLDHQQGQLDDDASLLFVQYQPEDQGAMLP